MAISREHGMEQFARDARITTLYEGTTGIQSLDLIGRKTAATQGAGLKIFLAEVEAFAKQHEGDDALRRIHRTAAGQVRRVGQAHHRNPAARGRRCQELGAASTDYMFYSGYVVLAYWWARSVAAANASRPTAGVQGCQARHRPLLLRAHAAAHALAQGGDRGRRGVADGAGCRGIRRSDAGRCTQFVTEGV